MGVACHHHKLVRDDAQKVLLQGPRALQVTRYVEIAEGDPRREDFAWGWMSGRALISRLEAK